PMVPQHAPLPSAVPRANAVPHHPCVVDGNDVPQGDRLAVMHHDDRITPMGRVPCGRGRWATRERDPSGDRLHRRPYTRVDVTGSRSAGTRFARGLTATSLGPDAG